MKLEKILNVALAIGLAFVMSCGESDGDDGGSDPVCGNGTVETGEECDDGNTADGDGCSASCVVTDDPAVDTEPNDTYDAAQALTGGSASGSLDPVGDVDCYSIYLEAGDSVVFENFTAEGVCESGDPELELYNEAGESVEYDDDDGIGLCSKIDFIAEEAGNYSICINERGNNAVFETYLLTLVFNVCGDGTLAGVEECDDGNTAAADGCDASCAVEYVCGDGAQVEGEECDDGNTTPGDGCDASCLIEYECGNGTVDPREECDEDSEACSAECTITPTDDDVEPNDTVAEASAMSIGTVTGAIAPVGDVDCYAVALTGGTAYDIETNTPDGLCTGVDTVLVVYDTAGTELDRNDDIVFLENPCSAVTYTPSADETVVACVNEYADDELIVRYTLTVTAQ